MLFKLEGTQRSFSAKIWGLRDLNYWERLRSLRLFSIERRIERYRILYVRKIIMGCVPNCGLIWDTNNHNGIKLKTPKVGKYFSKSRESSFSYTATRLFNILPRELRDDISSSMDIWKMYLDKLLELIPDQPRTQSLIPTICDPITAKCSNSLLHWIPHLNLNGRYFTETNVRRSNTGEDDFFTVI